MSWTKQQQQAILSRGNVIVSAAAGTGKTAVLTERLYRLIEAGTDVTRLLVLTFTRAAAAEMKSRIEQRLLRAAEEAEEPTIQARLIEQAQAVSRAQITTIDAFCALVIRRGYHLIDLPPVCRIADELELAGLKDGVRDAFFTSLAIANDADYHTLLKAFRSEDAVFSRISELSGYVQSKPDPGEWIRTQQAGYCQNERVNALFSVLLSSFQEDLQLAVDTFAKACDLLPPSADKALSLLYDNITRCRGLLLAGSYDEYRSGAQSIDFGRLIFPKDTDKDDAASIKAARTAAKDLLKSQLGKMALTQQAEIEKLYGSHPVVDALCRLTLSYMDAFQAAKRNKSILDYSDLEHFALQILQHPEAAAEYRNKYDYIAVDEYQDSNRAQEALLSSVCREDNLFFVGDVKQCIYRFRQAEPELFLEKLTAFPAHGGTRIDLNSNFRSSGAVLEAVNDVFSAIMTRAAANLLYDEQAMLRQGRPMPAGDVSLHLIERRLDPDADASEDVLDIADAEAEAELIADTITDRIKNSSVTDAAAGTSRPYTYADFAILLRDTKSAQTFAQTLALRGIPCYAQASGGYFDAIEVIVFLNLLRVIDNRDQDIPLLSVLYSGIGDFSAAELIGLRDAKRDGSLLSALLCAGRGNTALGQKCAAFLNRIDRWRLESRLRSVEELIGLLLDETGFFSEMGALPGGAERQANLNALLSRAHAFLSSGLSGLAAFLFYIDRASGNAKLGAAQTIEADVVRIMTIHKSKGLEFPVVFLAQLGKRFYQKSATYPLLLHDTLGIGLRYTGDDLRTLETVAWRAVGQRIRQEELAEAMRVLYVAMTRAKFELHMIGCATDCQKKLDRAVVTPSPVEVTHASTLLDWVLCGKRSVCKTFLHPREAFQHALRGDAPAAALLPEDPDVSAALAARLSWRYPHEAAFAVPAKAAVSRVFFIGSAEAGDGTTEVADAGFAAVLPKFEVPAFIKSDATDAMSRGTATHAAMQYLDGKFYTLDAAKAYLLQLADRQLLTPEQASLADPAAVAWFSGTALYNRMLAAARCNRELPFSYEIGANRLFPNADAESILLQGVIDCCFLEDNEWVLLDYKTDYAPTPDALHERVRLHTPQLSIYREALEKLTALPVKETLLVFLSARQVVPLP